MSLFRRIKTLNFNDLAGFRWGTWRNGGPRSPLLEWDVSTALGYRDEDMARLSILEAAALSQAISLKRIADHITRTP